MFMNKNEFKNIRVKKGYTQVELSKELGLTVASISRLENGHTPISKLISIAIKSIDKLKAAGK